MFTDKSSRSETVDQIEAASVNLGLSSGGNCLEPISSRQWHVHYSTFSDASLGHRAHVVDDRGAPTSMPGTQLRYGRVVGIETFGNSV